MEFGEMRFANMILAARAIALDSYAITMEDVNHICVSYGFSLHDLTDDEINELFRMVDSYLPN